MAFDIYAANHDLNTLEICEIDRNLFGPYEKENFMFTQRLNELKKYDTKM